jgi:hypothetical protein
MLELKKHSNKAASIKNFSMQGEEALNGKKKIFLNEKLDLAISKE